MTGLRGKVAIVTGGGRGIGRAIARRLAAAGANVAIAARKDSELNETRRMIEQAGGRCLALSADVAVDADVARMVETTRSAFGRIDILINNAGVAPNAPIEKLDPPVFDAMIATNVRAVYLCCRAVWPVMSETGGTIINLSSLAAVDPFPGFAAYGGAKAFVSTFSRGLAQEGRERNIRVFCVAPGAVDTLMLREPFPEFPDDQTLQPDDVAAFVELLLGPAARHVDGQMIEIRKR